MPNVWWNTYEPALTNDNWKTSAAGGQWTRKVWDYLHLHEIDVTNVSVDESGDSRLNTAQYYRPDAIVLCWRWPMPNYPERHAAWALQMNLLEYATTSSIPVLIHDQDMKFDVRNEIEAFRNRGLKALITMPAFYPPKGIYTLHFPNPFDNIATRNVWPKRYRFGYIGSNYERYDQVYEAWGGTNAFGVDAHIWGNWLEPSPSRESPEQVKNDFPYVTFHDRIAQTDVLETLSQVMYTYHFCKPEYAKVGFITARWYEAAVAGTLAIVPDEMRLPPNFESVFKRDGISRSLSQNPESFDYFNAVERQRLYVDSIQQCKPWFDALWSIINFGV